MHMLAFAESVQLVPDGTFFIHIVLILVMIWILNRTLFRPINKIMEGRERSKGHHGGAADSILAEAGEKEARYSADILAARDQGYQLIEKEQKAAIAARDERIAQVKASVADTVASGKGEIERQRSDARSSIETNAEIMADKIAAAILGS